MIGILLLKRQNSIAYVTNIFVYLKSCSGNLTVIYMDYCVKGANELKSSKKGKKMYYIIF